MEPGLYKTILSFCQGYRDHRLGRKPPKKEPERLFHHHPPASAKCLGPSILADDTGAVGHWPCLLSTSLAVKTWFFIDILALGLSRPGRGSSAQCSAPQDLSRARGCQEDRVSLSGKEFLRVSNAIICSFSPCILHKVFNFQILSQQ